MMKKFDGTIILPVLLAVYMIGCSTQTHYVAPKRTQLRDLRRLAVNVNEFPPFLFFDRTQNISMGQAFLGIIGEAYRHYKDETTKAAINPETAIDTRSLLSDAFKTALVAKGDFDHIIFFDETRQKGPPSGYDAVVDINIVDWGVRTRPPRDPKYCWLWIDATITVQQHPKGAVFLNDKVTVAKNAHETKEHFTKHPSEIEEMFKEMIDTTGRRMGALLVPY